MMIKKRNEMMKSLLALLVVALIQVPAINADEEYRHAFTLESPNPEKSAWYGYQVKMNGNIIVLSEPYADTDGFLGAGKVYVYDADGTLISTLQSPTPGNNDNFGYRFDVLEDIIMVGEVSDIDGLSWAGKVHVFTADGTLQYSLQSEEPKHAGYFGVKSIAFNEEVMVISETGAETEPGMAGKIHLYDSEGAYVKSLLSPSPNVGGRFGDTVEVGEGFILVGEYGDIASDSPLGPGKVYLFDYNGTLIMTLQAPEPENQACFGSSISISGDWIVIGECFAAVDEVWRVGRAYIFNTDGELLQTLQSPTLKMNGRFGESVAIDGDRVVVGEWGANVNPFQYEGKAYVFDVDGNLLQNLTAPEPCARAAFGLDVDIYGDAIVIGESWADTEDLDQAGRVHVFRLGPPVEAQEPVKETSPVVEEEPEPEDTGGGIPGFPVTALALGTLLITIFLANKKNRLHFSLNRSDPSSIK